MDMLNEAVFLVGTQAQILFQHQLNMPKAPSTVVQQHAEAFLPLRCRQENYRGWRTGFFCKGTQGSTQAKGFELQVLEIVWAFFGALQVDRVSWLHVIMSLTLSRTTFKYKTVS